MEASGEQKGKQRGKTLLILLLLICIGVLAFVCYRLYTREEPEDGDGMIVVTKDTKNPQQKINEKVERGRISVRMTQNWLFEDGGKTSNAYLANSERNLYPLKFTITLEDTGEVIMESPEVPIGSCIEDFPLSVTLDPGQYTVLVAHQQVDDGEVINTVQTKGTITVR